MAMADHRLDGPAQFRILQNNEWSSESDPLLIERLYSIINKGG